MDQSRLFVFILSLILTYIGLPKIRNMLINSNVIESNYKFVNIPTSMGIIFIFVQVISLGVFNIIFNVKDDIIIIYLLGFVFIGILGLLDDLIGDKNIKGLKGHIKALYNGNLTTGGIKASLGLFISIIISWILYSGINIIINSIIIALFTNFINLFDLRPGRASKVFIFIALIFIITSSINALNLILLSLIGIVFPYIFLDLKGKAMMGDVGSNILGFSLGIYASYSYNIRYRIVILTFLILFHIISEKYSFSKIIEKNKLLKILDNMGR